MAASSGVRLSEFPVLSVRADDISGSFKEWLDEFELSVKFKTLELGYELVEVPGEPEKKKKYKFDDETKILALLKCVGGEGRRILKLSGLVNLDDIGKNKYADLIETLKKHYCRSESLFIRIQQFVTVRQSAGEDYASYLLRVETLSRSIELFESDDPQLKTFGQKVRTDLALVLAVNGLRDRILCRELIAAQNLTWEYLGKILRSRVAAEASVSKLHGSVNESTY